MASTSGPATSTSSRSKSDEVLGGGAGGVAAASPALPCLLLTSQPEVHRNASAVAKKAECLYVNLQGLIRRVGIERVGFVTLTFLERVTDRIEASARFNSLSTHVLRPQQLEFITVPERQGNGGFHFHCATAFPWDIRTGFNFDACMCANTIKREHYFKGASGQWGWDDPEWEREFHRLERIYFESANQHLREWWTYFRPVAKRYGFGRCETLPVISNGAAIARYIGAYVSTATDARTIADKGMRTVRYSLFERTASIKFSWADGNGAKWRRGLQLLGLVFGKDLDGLRDALGAKFQYRWRETIFVLAEFYDEAISFCVRVPEWADRSSRVQFLTRLLNHVQQKVTFDLAGLTSEPDCPF